MHDSLTNWFTHILSLAHLSFQSTVQPIRAGLPHGCQERGFSEIALVTPKYPLSHSRLWGTSTDPNRKQQHLDRKDSIKTQPSGALFKGNSDTSRECTIDVTVFLTEFWIAPSNIDSLLWFLSPWCLHGCYLIAVSNLHCLPSWA